MFRIAVLPHRPGVVYYHLLLRRETRIPGVAPFSFRIEIWDLFVHRGQKSYTPTAFGKLWTTPGVRCMKQMSHSPYRWLPAAHSRRRQSGPGPCSRQPGRLAAGMSCCVCRRAPGRCSRRPAACLRPETRASYIECIYPCLP